MKKIRHNKKRNTAFLYESLIVELTKAIVAQNMERKNNIVNVITGYFAPSTNMCKDLNFYKTLNETNELDPYTAEKLIYEVKKDRSKLIDEKQLFNEQTKLINLINKRLSKNIYLNFVPGYKSLATISQIFNSDISTKNRVLLEKELMQKLTAKYKPETEEEIIQIDNLVFSKFTEKFNNKYGASLLDEQRQLLSKYVFSFADNTTEFKAHLNEEVSRLKSCLHDSLRTSEIQADAHMLESTKKVIAMMESFKERELSRNDIQKILEIQQLVSEIEE
jgi:hypothetical protein